MGNVATGLIIGGAVVGSAGLIVWLTAPSSPDRTALAFGLGSARLSW
jgi:hypothetical protein